MPNPFAMLFYSALKNCTEGQICITDPQGQTHYFGTNDQRQTSLTITNSKFFSMVCLHGDIGFGEAYTEGYWQTDDLAGCLSWFALNAQKLNSKKLNWLSSVQRLWHKSRLKNGIKQAKQNIHDHYDLSNDFFALWLDETMAYSSGLFLSGQESLKQAQIQKFESLIELAELNANDHVLEIGTGWGGFAIHMAQSIGCKVTTVTISEQQFRFAQQKIKDLQLEHLIELKLLDYRLLQGQFDKIVSIEMIEAIGYKQHPVFVQKCAELLKPGGHVAIQGISFPDEHYEEYLQSTNWLQKHIFPGSQLISAARFKQSFKTFGKMRCRAQKSLGLSYAKTLEMWAQRVREKQKQTLKLGFDERFIRSWLYYLAYCQAGFATSYIDDLQIAFQSANISDTLEPCMNPNLNIAKPNLKSGSTFTETTSTAML